MPSPIVASYPTSPLQQGMLFQRLYEKHPGVDLVQVCCDCRESLDSSRFEDAWQTTIDRHDALRTSIDWCAADAGAQHVHESVIMPWIVEDWRSLRSAEVESRWQRFLYEDRNAGFDLSSPPLMRLLLIRTGWRRWRFCWTFHHLMLDSRSVHLVLDEVFARMDRTTPSFSRLDASPPQFRDYIAWHQHQDWVSAEPFWRAELSGFTKPNALALAKLSSEKQLNEEAVGEHFIYLSRQQTTNLRKLATHAGATLNNTIQAAWTILLSRYNNEMDVVIGATRACRHSTSADASNTVGLFVNTLPLRIQFRDGMTVTQCLRELRRRWLAMRDFENTPLLHVQRWSDIARNERLFHTILNFQDPSWDKEFACRRGQWSNRRFSIRGQSGYPITLDVYGGEQLSIKMMFDVRRFDTAIVQRMMGHLGTLLENMSRTPDSKISDVSMMPAEERKEVLTRWNQRPTNYPRGQRVHELFAAQASRTPEAIAITFDNKTTTYRKLDQRANRLARHLQKQGVSRATKVIVCLDRGRDLIIALLAVLKAGGTYVPLDPDDPPQRITQVLEDTGARLLLTQEKRRASLLSLGARILCMDTERDAIEAHSNSPLIVPGTADDLAYVIYTSGSTGRPKGVCVPHRAVVRLVQSTNYATFGPDQTLLQFAPVSFDASTFEIWGALLNGGRLAVIKPGIPALDQLACFIQEQQVTLMFITTGLFVQLIAHQSARLTGVQQLLTGGEVMPLATAEKALHALPHTQLINCYGPTENTTFTTYHRMSLADVERTSIPIGRPIANTTVLVLGTDLQPQPVGVPGELFTGGEGLALGYLNDAELTSAKFIQHPFDSRPNARLYRTGDLVRWLPDGTLEFIGRMDEQVKVRGFRIEPGEIETILAQHPSVTSAVVCARADSDGTKRLHGWYLVRDNCAIEPATLQAYLSTRLPAFMIPATLLEVGQWPLTLNGKIDKAALPQHTPKRQSTSDTSLTTTQEMVRGLFCQTLNLNHADLHDDFFSLGGHSLKAMQLVSAISSAFKVTLPVRTLFHSPTVESLADWIDTERLKLQSVLGGSRLPASLVAIRPGGSRPPLFVLPGGWGGDNEMLVFARLAAYLGNDQPLYGFNARVIQRQGSTSVAEIASRYLDDMRRVHSAGPFLIAGECIAGSIAHAMACELRRRGQPLPVLLMLDAHCPHEDRLASFSVDHWQDVPPEVRTYYETLLRWTPEHYDGRLQFIASETSLHDESALGWQNGIHGQMLIRTVPGDHHSYIREHIAHTGHALRSLLDQFNANEG